MYWGKLGAAAVQFPTTGGSVEILTHPSTGRGAFTLDNEPGSASRTKTGSNYTMLCVRKTAHPNSDGNF